MTFLRESDLAIVVDVEADGPFPGYFSMLSLGAVATTATEERGTFYRTMYNLEGAAQDERTMKWWTTHPLAWEETRRDRVNPQIAMAQFAMWVDAFECTPVFVAQPDVFDYQFVSWYFWRFGIDNPFDCSGSPRTLDLRSYTAGKISKPLLESGRRHVESRYLEGMPPHTHLPLDDARGTATLLRNIAKVPLSDSHPLIADSVKVDD